MITARRPLVASLLLNAFLLLGVAWYVFFHVGIEKYIAKLQPPHEGFLNDVYYQATLERYRALNARLDRSREYVVFAGDSLVEQLPVSEVFPGGTVLNRGIGFDTTRGLLARIESNVANVPLALCVLLIGSNDLDYRGIEETVRNMDAILQKIGPRRAVVLGVPPCRDRARNRDIIALNGRFAELVATRGGRYVETFTPLVGAGGVLKKEYTYDGVHLTLVGALVLLDQVRPFVNAAVGRRVDSSGIIP